MIYPCILKTLSVLAAVVPCATSEIEPSSPSSVRIKDPLSASYCSLRGYFILCG